MKRLMTIILLLTIAQIAMAQQWARTTGPEGGDIYTVAAYDSTVLTVMAPSELYRHEGNRWQYLGSSELRSLVAVDGVFLGTAPVANTFREIMLRSTDQGETWQQTGPDGENVRLTLDGPTVYSFADDTIYASTDQGLTWQFHSAPGANLLSLFVHDSTMLAGSFQLQGMIRSGDGGKTWHPVTAGIPANRLPEGFLHDSTGIYIALGDAGIFHSTDEGITWSAMNDKLPHDSSGYPEFYELIRIGDEIWGATPTETYRYRSESGWSISSYARMSHFAESAKGFYHARNGGIARRTKGEEEWKSMNAGLIATRVLALVSYGDAVYASTGGILYQTDGRGMSWTAIAPIDADEFVIGSDAIYARGRRLNTAGIFRSLNGEDNWSRVPGTIPNVPMGRLSALAASGTTLYAGFFDFGLDRPQPYWKYGGIYRSTDRGESWMSVSAGLPHKDSSDVPVNDIIANGNIVLALTVDGLYRSDDTGTTWTKVPLDLPGTYKFGRMARMGETFYLAGENVVYVSTDGGISWNLAGDGLPSSISINDLTVIYGHPFVISQNAFSRKAYRLDNGHWTDLSGQLPQGIIFTTMIGTGHGILAGTQYKGVWSGGFTAPASTPEPGIGVRPDLQAAPNPFTNRLAVSFTLMHRSTVHMTLVSPLGKEIELLSDRTLDEGTHHADINGEALPSGIYHVRLTIDGHIEHQQVLKVR